MLFWSAFSYLVDKEDSLGSVGPLTEGGGSEVYFNRGVLGSISDDLQQVRQGHIRPWHGEGRLQGYWSHRGLFTFGYVKGLVAEEGGGGR